MQVVLVMFRSDGERRSFSVVRDITVLGRREDCDLRIPLSDISRKHCRLIRSGHSVRLEDLGSSNGTLCNGERVTSVELQPGDVLGVGPVTFVVQIDGVPSDEELNPEAASPRQAASFAPQDTAAAAAAVGVGMVHEVAPATGADSMANLPPVDADELEEIEDLGAAPLVAQSTDDEIVELEPVPSEPIQQAASTEALDRAEGMEPFEDLEPNQLEEVTDPTPAAGTATASIQEEPILADHSTDDFADLSDFDEAPAAGTAPPPLPVPPASAAHRATPPTPPTMKSPRAVPTPPQPIDEEPVTEVVEGELAASDEFEAVTEEQSEFEIIDDDASHSSASGDLNIDWSEESKSGR
jgi:pSer/pThr/pTyr-binding forkhead associated (FHA) protein